MSWCGGQLTLEWKRTRAPTLKLDIGVRNGRAVCLPKQERVVNAPPVCCNPAEWTVDCTDPVLITDILQLIYEYANDPRLYTQQLPSNVRQLLMLPADLLGEVRRTVDFANYHESRRYVKMLTEHPRCVIRPSCLQLLLQAPFGPEVLREPAIVRPLIDNIRTYYSDAGLDAVDWLIAVKYVGWLCQLMELDRWHKRTNYLRTCIERK